MSENRLKSKDFLRGKSQSARTAKNSQFLSQKGIHPKEGFFPYHEFEEDNSFLSARCISPVFLGNFFPSPWRGKRRGGHWKRKLKRAIHGRRLTESLEILSEQGIEGDFALLLISSMNEKMGGM